MKEIIIPEEHRGIRFNRLREWMKRTDVEDELMTRNPERIDKILLKLAVLWHKYPDQRLSQLLSNYTRFGVRGRELGTIKDIFYYEDDVILKDIEAALKMVELGSQNV